MPQKTPRQERSLEERLEFKAMMGRINTLYLGASVLILLDLSYMSRFWTQAFALAAVLPHTSLPLPLPRGALTRTAMFVVRGLAFDAAGFGRGHSPCA